MYFIICCQWIHQIAFLNWLCQYLSFLDFFKKRFSTVKKCEVTPHCVYRDSLTLIYHISSNRHMTLAALLSTHTEVNIAPRGAAPLQQVFWFWGFVFHFHCWKKQKQSFEICYNVVSLLWNTTSFKWCPLIRTSPRRLDTK